MGVVAPTLILAQETAIDVSAGAVQIGLGAAALALLGYLFRSLWKQSAFWEQLTNAARTAESSARADAAAARADAAAARAEAHTARMEAADAHQAFERCEHEHTVTKTRLQQLKQRLRELGLDV